MRKKLKLFRDSLKLVWQSAPGWASATIVIPLARSIFPLIFIWLIRNIIDNITSVSAGAATPSFSKTFLPVIVLSAVWFLDEAFGSLAIFAGKKQSFLLEKHMYDLLHAKAAGIDLINFEHPEYFDVLARASREAPWRPNSILNHLIMLTRGLLSLLIMTGVLLKLNAALAILLIFINIPGVWMRVHYSGILYNFKRQQTPEMRKASYFNWILTGDRPSRELRLFGLGNYFMELFRKSFHSQNEEEINIIRKRTSIELISHFFKAAALLLILLYVSARTIDGSITVGEMAMFLLAYRQGMVYAKEVMTSLGGLYEDSLFVADTFEFLNLGENIKSQASAATFTELKKKITVKNLSFRYPGSKSATINNLSFEINRGEIIAIVGPNGAGKSTLVKLLCRLYDPESGNIMYDNTDVREIDPDEYRRQFSVIFQDFMLYNLTAGENIRLGNLQKDKTSENLRKAALQSGIDSTLNSLPAGYDTPIGNLFSDSRELSWGEWQKIALARALFRESPVLILDEPSSALDAETEYDIFSRFRQIVNGRTSILITHRFTNVSLADRIIVLDKGTIAESGTHSELMQKKGIYSRMYIRQSSRFAQ